MAYRSYRTTMDFGFGYGITPAVKKLLIANTAAFVVMLLAQAAGYGSAVRWLMLTPSDVTHYFALWQPVTYLFLHPFGIPSTSHWTGAAIIVQFPRTKSCIVTRSRTSTRPMPSSLAG